MKIAINSNIINTKNIYEITKFEKRINSHNITESIYFYIKMFNNEKIRIDIDGDCIFKRKPNFKWNDWYKENYDSKIVLLENKANEIRNQIINIWSKNKSKIIQINTKDENI